MSARAYIIGEQSAQAREVVSPDGEAFVQAMCTNSHVSAFLSAAGNVFVSGQRTNPITNLIPVHFPETVIRVAVGREFVAAITDEGNLYLVNVWDKVLIPRLVELPHGVDSIALCTMEDVFLALDSHGHCYIWGASRFAGTQKPRRVPGLKNVTQIACGMSHMAALTREGSVYVWGTNTHGVLGLGESVPDGDVMFPTLVTELSEKKYKIGSISCGRNVTFALSQNRLFAWGENKHDIIPGVKKGSEAEHVQLLPVHVTDLPGDIFMISAGLNHGAAVGTANGLITWGSGDSGKLGREVPEGKEDLGPGPVACPFGGIISCCCASTYTLILALPI